MIIKTAAGKFKARVRIDGKKRDRTFDTEREAKEYKAQHTLRLRAALPTSSRVVPRFSEFCLETYGPDAEEFLKASTYDNRKYTIKILVEAFGHLPINRITADEILKFRKERKKAGIGRVKVNDDVSKLLTILRHAKAKKVPLEVPEIKRLPGGATKGRVRPWTEEQVQALYAAISKECPHLLSLTVALINTGCRPGEGLAFEWGWVNLRRRIISIEPNEFWQPKDGEPREVTISDALLEILERPRQHPRWVFPTLPTMRNPQGERYSAWPQNQWDRARKRAGVGGSPHVCRHTYASHFLQSTPDMFLLAQVLGHSTTKVTAMYSHLLPGHLLRAQNAVNIAPRRLLTAGSGDHAEP